MAAWERNPNRRGSDHDAYDGAQESPPAGLSGTLDQRPVTAPTPVSPTVAPHRMLPDGQTSEPAPITPNAECIPLVHSTPNAETVPPAPQPPAPVLDQDITSSPGPRPSPAPNTHDALPAWAKHPNAAKGPSTKHHGFRQLILCSVDFLLLFHYLCNCASFVV